MATRHLHRLLSGLRSRRARNQAGSANDEVADAFSWIGPALASLIAVNLTRFAWGGRPPAGQDTMALLIRTEHGLGLFADGKLDGWLPNFSLGYQEFLFYGPGQTMLIGLARIGSLGMLSSTGGYKLLAITSLALLPFSVAWLARGMGLSRCGAGMAAILSLLVSNPFGVGVHGVFENSLIAQQVAGSLVFIVLGGVLRLLFDPRPRWTLVTGVALAALMVTHLISTVILALLLVVALPTAVMMNRPRFSALKALFGAGVIGAGLAAFWLVPLLAHRDLRGTVATWSTPALPDRLRELWQGTFVFGPHVAQVVAAASLYALFHLTRQRRWAALALMVPVGYVLLGRFLLHRYPDNDLMIQIENRGIGMAAIIATFPLAELCAHVVTRLRRPTSPVTIAAAAGLAVAFVLRSIQPWAAVAQQMPPGTPSLHAAAVELRRVVPPGARWVQVRDFPTELSSTGVVHPDFWLAHQSRRWTANSFNPESSSGPAATGDHILDRPTQEAARDLARLGVVVVVATTPETSSRLESPSFRVVWRRSVISILEVVAPEGQPSPSSLVATSSPATATLDRAAPEHLAMTVRSAEVTAATVAVAWSPKWQGRLNGRPVPLERTSDGIVEVQLPAGASRLALDYSSDVWDKLGLLITLVTAAGLIETVRRRRRSDDDPRPPLRPAGQHEAHVPA